MYSLSQFRVSTLNLPLDCYLRPFYPASNKSLDVQDWIVICGPFMRHQTKVQTSRRDSPFQLSSNFVLLHVVMSVKMMDLCMQNCNKEWDKSKNNALKPPIGRNHLRNVLIVSVHSFIIKYSFGLLLSQFIVSSLNIPLDCYLRPFMCHQTKVWMSRIHSLQGKVQILYISTHLPKTGHNKALVVPYLKVMVQSL